jgi:hypothetical protein
MPESNTYKPKETLMSKKSELVTLKYLDISTGHMSKKDNELLSNNVSFAFIYNIDPYGYSIYVPEDITETLHDMKYVGMSESFRKIIKEAHKKGFHWVKFDRDGTTYPQFKSFEW